MKRGGWGRVREAPAYHELQSAVASKTPPQPPATATRHPTVAEGVRAGRASAVAGPF